MESVTRQITEQKLLQLINDIENLEDFIKCCAADFKMDKQSANEILKLISEAKGRALK